MEEQLIQIREQQKASWNKFSGGWDKWNDFIMHHSRPVADEMIQSLKLKKDDVVFDAASGTGEPGITIAGLLPDGKVISGDLSENMLKIANANAQKKLLTNFEVTVCDVCELPFRDNMFDAISCRFGFMFFPDMMLAAREMYRVLKPGGRIAVAVWSEAADNFWFTAIINTVAANIEMPQLPPGAPGMFRCAKEGLMANLFAQVGFKNVSEQVMHGVMDFSTVDTYWSLMNDVAAPIMALVAKADDPTREKIKKEIYKVIGERYRDGNVNLPYGARVISAEK